MEHAKNRDDLALHDATRLPVAAFGGPGDLRNPVRVQGKDAIEMLFHLGARQNVNQIGGGDDYPEIGQLEIE